MDNKICVGTVVLSKCGRDKGRHFIVCGHPEDEYVLLADGDVRKTGKPKRKKLKHIKLTGDILSEAKDGIDGLSDKKLKALLKAYSAQAKI